MIARSRRLGGWGLAIVASLAALGLSAGAARGADEGKPKKVEDLSAYMRQYLGDAAKAEKVGAGYVVLTWKAVEGAHHYRLTRTDGDKKRFVGTSPAGRFVFAGTWHPKPAIHIHWDGKSDLNDLSVRAYRVYRVTDGTKTRYAETMGRYALIDGAKVGERFAVSAVNHAGVEGPAAELTIAATWKGPGEAFHLRTGAEDSVKPPKPATRPGKSAKAKNRERIRE